MKDRKWLILLIMLLLLPFLQNSRILKVQQIKKLYKPQLPDLIIKTIPTIVGPPCVNKEIRIQIAVKNIGNAIAPESVVGIRIGGAGFKTIKVPKINPGAHRSVYLEKVKLPTAMTYVVTAWADYGNKIKESNEYNNKKVKYQRAVQCCPDLKIESIALQPYNPTSAQSFKCQVIVINGGRDTCGPTIAAMRIGGSTKMFTFPVPKLMERNFHTFSKVLFINRAGRYRINIWIDYGQKVKECNEKNNFSYRTIRVSGPSGPVSLRPDLVVSKLTMFPQKPGTSDQIKWTVIVRNNGTGPANASSLRVVVSGIGSLGVFSVPALAPGRTQSFYPERTISKPGKYKIHAYADYSKQVRESKEYNNRKHLTFTIVK